MSKERIRVYAWEFPVRLTHWINALCIVVLSVTGFYIGNPFIHAISSKQYIMGWIRYIHFVAAYTFVCSVVLRFYWAFVGNRYARWGALIPHTSRQWRDLADTVKFYLFLSKKPPYAVGHTAFAGLVYILIFLLYVWQIISGFALYNLSAQTTSSAALGGWLTGIMHLQTIRLYHHLGMYVLLAFVMAHIYIGWYLDSKERNGIMGSIFGGYKFVTGKEWE
ncbi:MAG: Ni/Fe-hydrogenase, b-type cytochrome subunit [Nitrospirae bacterium]|nr:MAG: Ni/Fe-hydrogenase, b-type cytochrome subunit [Nitrospirota bacterium]